MKKSTLLPLILLVYLAVMSAIGFPRLVSGEFTPLFYFGLIAITLSIIYLLRRNLLSRERHRKESQKATVANKN